MFNLFRKLQQWWRNYTLQLFSWLSLVLLHFRSCKKTWVALERYLTALYEKLFIFLFIFFHFIYSWLKITHLHTKKSLYSLYSNKIELNDVNSVTEQEMQSFPNQFFKSMWTSWQTRSLWKRHVQFKDFGNNEKFQFKRVNFLNKTYYGSIVKTFGGMDSTFIWVLKRLTGCTQVF